MIIGLMKDLAVQYPSLLDDEENVSLITLASISYAKVNGILERLAGARPGPEAEPIVIPKDSTPAEFIAELVDIRQQILKMARQLPCDTALDRLTRQNLLFQAAQVEMKSTNSQFASGIHLSAHTDEAAINR